MIKTTKTHTNGEVITVEIEGNYQVTMVVIERSDDTEPLLESKEALLYEEAIHPNARQMDFKSDFFGQR